MAAKTDFIGVLPKTVVNLRSLDAQTMRFGTEFNVYVLKATIELTEFVNFVQQIHFSTVLHVLMDFKNVTYQTKFGTE
jgi:hypothetical protein